MRVLITVRCIFETFIFGFADTETRSENGVVS